MGLVVAPLTDAILSTVPREHAGSVSGLINTVQQMGNALSLVSVVFYGVVDDRLTEATTPTAAGTAFADGFQHALGWVAAVMAVIFLLMWALPGLLARPAGPGADDEAGDSPFSLSRLANHACAAPRAAGLQAAPDLRFSTSQPARDSR